MSHRVLPHVNLNPYLPRYYFRKLVVSGPVVELLEYGLPVIREPAVRPKSPGRCGQAFTTEEQKKENRKKTASRARLKVFRYANANFSNKSKFLTLTFADNITDLRLANYMLTNFFKRLKRRFGLSPQYICVVEFQKRGAIHYHILINCPYIDVNELARIWSYGFVKINRIDNIDNIGAYITKYMTKETLDERLIGQKCYFMSRNLKAPEVTIMPEVIDSFINEMDVKRVAYSCSYETECYGTCRKTQYVLNTPLSPNDFRRPLTSDYFPPRWPVFSPLPRSIKKGSLPS